MKTKEAINILYYAVEYYDMMYNSGNRKHDKKEKIKVSKAFDHVYNKLMKDSEI
tara:strand:- start:381 stop:542 length:162 start_codon:yes stop_codon:yes gene_type:complete